MQVPFTRGYTYRKLGVSFYSLFAKDKFISFGFKEVNFNEDDRVKVTIILGERHMLLSDLFLNV